MSKILEKIAAKHVKPTFTEVKPGDTVRVYTRIKEGNKERTQYFEGVVIRRRGGIGPNGTFTVRRIASGVGVERTFALHSPVIEKIQIQRGAKVRRAQLHYLRGLTGKAARLTEQPVKQADRDQDHPWPKRFGVHAEEIEAVEEVADEAQMKAEEAEAEEAAKEEPKADAKADAGGQDAAEGKGKAEAKADTVKEDKPKADAANDASKDADKTQPEKGDADKK